MLTLSSPAFRQRMISRVDPSHLQPYNVLVQVAEAYRRANTTDANPNPNGEACWSYIYINYPLGYEIKREDGIYFVDSQEAFLAIVSG